MSGWSKIKRFRHPNVASILFSPREKFLMCSDPRSASRVTVQFFELARPGRPRRTFYVKPNEETSMEAREDLFRPDSNDNSQNGPLFKWSHSERYFARKTLQNGGLLSVYETNEFKLLGRSSIKAKGISTFEWSPGAYNARDDQDNIVAYFTPEESNQAACLYIQEIPSRKILRSKPCFTVSNCQIFWQSNGDYLCAQVTRHSKTGKTEFTNFELCRLRGVNYPMEMLEIREPIAHFAWEPFGGYLFKNKGERFCIIHGDGPNKTVSFYTMAKTGKRSGRKKLALLFQLHKQTVNKIYWSPNGRHVVLHGSIQLVFVDVDKNEVLASPEHPHCNKIEWDPSGRFIVTAEEFDTVHGSSIEKSFRFWSFQGKPLHDEKRSKFMSFSWRPRPSQNLVMKIQPTKQEAKIPLEQRKPTMKDVIDNMSESRKRYIIQDNDVINTRVKAEALEKLKGREDFQKLLDEAELIMKQGYAQAGLPHPNDIPDDCQINIVCMEEFIDEKKEPVKWSTR